MIYDEFTKWDYPEPLEEQEQLKLIIKAQNGDEAARNILINHNIRLIIKMIKKKKKNIEHINDFIQYGIFGLKRAIEKFDINKGYKFSTYATRWILQSIQRNLEKDIYQIRLPNYLHCEIRECEKYINKIWEEEHREVGTQELIEKLNIKYETSQVFEKRKMLSLNQVDEGSNHELEGAISNGKESIESIMIRKENIENVLNNPILKKREKETLQLLYFGDKKYTLEDISNIYKTSKETVRLYKVKGLKKLKKYYQEKGINNYEQYIQNVV